MNRSTLDRKFIDIAGFMAISRRHLLPEATATAAATRSQKQGFGRYRDLAHRMLLTAGLGMFLAGPVFADADCAPMGGRGAHGERHARHMEQHHKQLHEALKLTPEQENGWITLMASEQGRPVAGAGGNEDWSKLSTPERAERMLARSRAHQEHMSEHVAALKAFYATLTAEQQKVFEDAHSRPRDGKRARPASRTPGADKAPAKP